VDLRHPESSDRAQAGDARITIVAAQAAGLGEFGGGVIGGALEAVCRGEIGAGIRMCRIGVARFFESVNRLVVARLQQVYNPNPSIPIVDGGLARAKADGSLDDRDHLLYRPGQEFAPADRGYCEHQIAV
jgi:hypothetical protein